MRIIIGITIILLISVFAIASLYFSNLNTGSRSNNRVLNAIPADADIILQFSNDPGFYEIFKDYTVFNDIIGEKNEKRLKWLKSHLDSMSEDFVGQKIFLSFHERSKAETDFLWLIQTNGQTDADLPKELFGSEARFSPKNKRVVELSAYPTGETFYAFSTKGVIAGSFSLELLEEAMNEAKPKVDKQTVANIDKAIQANNDQLVNVFVNHRNPGIAARYFKGTPGGNFTVFNSFKGFSALNMNYRSDALIFNGVTSPDTTVLSYTGLFLAQDPVKNTIKRILPYNLANSICYGLSDYNRFNRDLRRLLGGRKEKDTLEQALAQMTAETGVNPERDIRKLWGREFSIVQLSTYETLAIIQVTNGTDLSFYLEPVSSQYSPEIRKMDYGNLFYYYFGDPFRRFEKPFFSVRDNMIILSNSPTTVARFIQTYESERFIGATDEFRAFDQLISDQSNISMLMHVSNSTSLLKTLLKSDYAKIIDSPTYGYKKFYALSYQLISNKETFFSNFYLGYPAREIPDEEESVYLSDTLTKTE